ncbi:HvfA family oxazolone/thioamide-modified RiPP metallophore [Chondromyces apiculatus]|uniref:HvfA family oxazolone/thioamide-modified RiPP metallophore n=1 Tax=Chondromyces apiculatus TaxID=51 RepID=UPI003F9E1914
MAEQAVRVRRSRRPPARGPGSVQQGARTRLRGGFGRVGEREIAARRAGFGLVEAYLDPPEERCPGEARRLRDHLVEEGERGEGRCGEEDGDARWRSEGRCGEEDGDACWRGEGRCGEEDGDARWRSEGRCGEGRCGEEDGDARWRSEGRCGEGRCGEGRCGEEDDAGWRGEEGGPCQEDGGTGGGQEGRRGDGEAVRREIIGPEREEVLRAVRSAPPGHASRE